MVILMDLNGEMTLCDNYTLKRSVNYTLKSRYTIMNALFRKSLAKVRLFVGTTKKIEKTVNLFRKFANLSHCF